MENKQDMLHRLGRRKYLTVAIVLAALLFIGAFAGIIVYFQKPDENGHSLMEIEQAKKVVLRYISAMERRDRAGAEECCAEESLKEFEEYQKVGSLSRLDYDLKWTHYTVYDLCYRPYCSSYRILKKTMGQESEPQDWILLTMYCDLTTRYETVTCVEEWLLVREDRSKQWKILRTFMED